jgi:hypothetical protein
MDQAPLVVFGSIITTALFPGVVFGQGNNSAPINAMLFSGRLTKKSEGTS